MFLFCFTKILNQAFYMTHTFDWGFFTLLVALAHGAPHRPSALKSKRAVNINLTYTMYTLVHTYLLTLYIFDDLQCNVRWLIRLKNVIKIKGRTQLVFSSRDPAINSETPNPDFFFTKYVVISLFLKLIRLLSNIQIEFICFTHHSILVVQPHIAFFSHH